MSTANAENGLTAESEATPDQPVVRTDRIVSLDFVRGIAVLGIVWANITAFGHPPIAYFWPEALPNGGTPVDQWVWLFQYVFVDGKFRGLFTLLFGAGVYLFTERAWARGQGRGLQARRLLWLGLFGLAHFFFLWWGDILFIYAIAGLVSLLFLRLGAWAQFWWAAAIYALGALFFAGGLYFQLLVAGDPSLAPEMAAELDQQMAVMLAEKDAALAAYAGSYSDIFLYNLQANGAKLGFYPILAMLETLPLMLMGMALYRWGLFEQRFARAKALGWAWAGIVFSAAWSFWLGWDVMRKDFAFYDVSFAFNGIAHVARLPMVLGLLVVLAYWAPAAAATRLGQRFVAAGRAAFTNYLGTSLLMVFVFQGWTLGLYGELNRLELFIPMAAAWAIMLLWSKPWLERYRYGPLEWLWRCLTYWQRFPIRR